MEVDINPCAQTSKSHVFINAFICLYLAGTFIMCSPPSACRDALVKAIKPYFNFFGLYQYFWMYAPNPPRVYTIHVYAEITFKDGSRKIWEFPSLLKFKSDFYKYQSKHRYYQWKYYLFNPKDNPQILKDAAVYAARVNNIPGNPPVLVHLFKQTIATVVPWYMDNGKLTTQYEGLSDLFFYNPGAGEL